MGKIIVNNIKGMGWAARIALTVVCTLLASTFIYQGWYNPLQTHAAVSRQSNWTSQYAATAFPNGAVNAGYTIAAGSNRLLLVAISSTTTGASTKTITVTYGGQPLTLAASDNTVSRVNHTALYYLNEAGIAAASGTSLNVTVSGGTSYYNYVYAAVYAGVNQTTPFTSAVNYNSSTADSAVGPLASFTVGANNQAVEVINLARSSSGTTARTITTWDTDWGTANIQPTPIATSGYCATLYIRDRASVPSVATADTSQHTASSTSTYDSMTAMSINPATDATVPTVTINQAAGQADPTAAATINFTVVFSEAVTGFATGDVTINGTAGGTKTATVTGSGTTYNVAVTGMTSSGTVIASVPAGVATDGTNTNNASTSTDNSITYDVSGPAVTINQAAGQTDPGSSTVNFTVVFSEAVTGFTTGDVTLSGTAGATTATVTGSGTTYSVAVTGMTGSGTVVASIGAGVAIDALGNANSASTSSDNSVTCDLTPPSGLSASLPADEAADLALAVTLQSTTATDANGPVQYYFQISTDNTFATVVETGGWQTTTSYTPSNRAYGTTYFWRVKARDGFANETAYTTPRSFSTLASCVRNDPTLSVLTGTGGVAATIATDHGTAVYNLLVKNNDYGSCPSTQFNLSVSDTDIGTSFDPPALGVPNVTLAPGAQTTIGVTITATAGETSGQSTARVTSASDVNHAAVISNDVTTTINVVACYPGVPYLIVGPDASFVAKGGMVNYTVTMKNTDTGTGCAPVTYNLVKVSESNAIDFNSSTLSAPSLTLNSGQSGSVTLSVSAKATAAVGAINLTTISTNATGHDSPADIVATTTVGNPMLHNSETTGSSKWSAAGGWGMPGTKYGEFICTTCHTDSGSATKNIQRIKEAITTPDATKGTIPGNGQPVYFNRTEGGAAQGVFGFDSGGTRASSKRVCEVCHTYDATGANGVKAHPYAAPVTLGNHYNADGKDCIKCHKHNIGFGVGNMSCNSCHGDSSVTTITTDNRYVVAPPVNTAGATGTLSGTGQVSNDAKVGAHQTHLRYLNGFSAYGNIDQRCEACHGTLPTGGTHVDNSSSPNGKWSGLAIHNTTTPMNPNFSGGTCANTYCHNPAGTNGTLNALNAGTGVTPSWTNASYIADGLLKTEANCNLCHKSPGNIAGAITVTSNTNHSGFTINTDCAGCHGHNGGVGGSAGQQHIDGIKYGGGTACNSCHSYDDDDWATATHNYGGTPLKEGIGAHAKHIAYIKTRLGNLTLNATADMTLGYGLGNAGAVCGVCHSNSVSNHSTGTPGDPRTINFNLSTTYQFGPESNTTLWYNGSYNSSSATKLKTCSNISCHYFTSPAWSTY